LVELKLALSQSAENKSENKKSDSVGYPVDPHKICNLETDQKKLKDFVNEYRDLVRTTERVKNKKMKFSFFYFLKINK
jgi:hypothetical protein